ncbi:MAG: InlB B-repeat-containing protein [bacterium]
MFKSKSIRFPVILLVITYSCINVYAQPYLGPASLLSMPAHELKVLDHSDSLEASLQKDKFVSNVGGIAFGKIAGPKEGLTIHNLTLTYHPNSSDGQRLWLMVDGQNISANIYDWQLIPIARFANGSYSSAFTLFGQLLDPHKEEEVLSREGRILNYHPYFTDTLTGLRLFQLDILILYEFTPDLPKENDQYILGNGESEPNVQANQEGMGDFDNYFFSLSSSDEYQSYIICDFGQDIRFDIHDGSLNIGGNPYYYFWQYKFDAPDYDEEGETYSIIEEILQSVEENCGSYPEDFCQREWLIEALIPELKRYEESYDIYVAGTVIDLINIEDDNLRKAALDRYSTDSLYEFLVTIRIDMDAYEILSVDDLSDQVSARPDLLRNINPAVWDSGVTVMRYSAFFRYCKENFPQEWNTFMAQIDTIAAGSGSQIITPTVMLEDCRGNYYTVTFTQTTGGSISGDIHQTVPCGGDTTSVTAVPDSSYIFTGWSDGSIDNPRIITAVISDQDIVASFTRKSGTDGDDENGGCFLRSLSH